MSQSISLPCETTIEAAPLSHFLNDSSFWFPENLLLSAWLEHAPFAFWLMAAARPGRLVELGSHHGFSYLAFCQAIQRLGLNCSSYAVDTWTGDAHTGSYGEEVFATLSAYHEPRYAAFSSLLRTRFDDALPHFENGSIDLLHIDGQHRYEDVRHDFETWQPKLSERGVVLLHDINVHRDDFGVARLWRELRLRFPGFAFQHGSGLGVLGVGKALPQPVSAFLDLEGSTAARVSQTYARLGAAVTAQYKVEEQAATLHRLHVTSGVNDQLRTGKAADAQLIARLRAEMVSAKASEGRALAAASRLTAEKRRLGEENDKRDDVIRIIQGDAAGVRVVLAACETELQAARDKQAHFRQETETLRSALGYVDGELARTRQDLHSHAETLALTHSSLAWRLTSPLRHLTRISDRGLYSGPLGQVRLWRDRSLLLKSPLFDGDWYRRTYLGQAPARTDPARHFLQQGAANGYDPGPTFSSAAYLAGRPNIAAAHFNPLLHALRAGSGQNASADPAVAPAVPGPVAAALAPAPASASVPAAAELVMDAFPDSKPFPVFSVPASGTPRVTMVTDSVNADSLYGGVATGLVLAAALAERLGGTLRILTRVQALTPDSVRDVLESNGVAWQGNIAFDHAPIGSTHHQIDVSEDDRFITTSWWTTRAMLRSVGARQLTYLLQEDERMFYPHGDERLRCAELLAEPALRIVVNTRLLLDHLAGSGVPDLAGRAVAFEPAFPFSQAAVAPTGGRLNFFFYARPNHARNLYLRGIEALAAAIEDGHLDPVRWAVHFVGDGGNVRLPRKVTPQVHTGLSRTTYNQLVQRMDAGLSLMYTPHPSYPPIDLALCGAVVVTNRYGAKTSLEQFSSNVLCVEPDVASLAQAIGRATALAASRPRSPMAGGSVGQDWRKALAVSLDWIAGTPNVRP